jgi:hypothetical protein
MDGHFGNMRTDGERTDLSDFGLAIPHFDLSAAELDFAERNVVHANHTLQHLREFRFINRTRKLPGYARQKGDSNTCSTEFPGIQEISWS